MEMPIHDALWKIAQKQSMAQSKDDQICTSTGCPENLFKEKEEAKIVQYRTNLPLDPEITQNIKSERYAAEYHGESTSYNGKNAQ